ncbi:uncharacterized protein L969DRAFT_54405 [Mixia osmundae IAM 14324]|uniref:Polynucleotide 5'-hydroxyl-kinase GRC3 n=1 Tax=Mixia osmundae (strain CBS 9802 / IAM 14324 / JCM 22182 / KY 12970) TaxID=764103 RepID=G7E1M5_MIXOS|nr:uncharacterized protein L969DRAFT_54405 [Mixia osmundae IAM 14324]KEI36685.1 hypothetical protein L969DRAFT_54405 [Mixia osmundae IAM 14324]GAA96735.1 hypothetical protein E5Q_03406 [Mixia osmundae IAM 14324]
MEARPVDLPPLQELRFELEGQDRLLVTLVSGTAEVFGYELAPQVVYPFSDELRGAIFTWHGCTLSLRGKATTEYIAQETTTPLHLNLHLALEQARLQSRPPASFFVTAQQDQTEQDEELPGPRVMVLGERNAGKSTLIKTLLNWAIRSGNGARQDLNALPLASEEDQLGPQRGVMLVNLDPSDGAMTVPGTFSIAPVYSCVPTTTPALSFGTTYSNGPSLPIILQQPSKADQASATEEALIPLEVNYNTLAPALNALSFFYGHTDWGRNDALAETQIKRLGAFLRSKLEEGGEPGLWRGGVLVDTPAELAERSRGQMLIKLVRTLGVNVIVVLGSEKLQVDITRLMSTNKSVKVLRVPKSGGVSDIDNAYRRRLRAKQIHSYFYGGPTVSCGALSPHNASILFDYLKVYRIGADFAAPSSALPLGQDMASRDLRLYDIDITESRTFPELVNHICAVLQVDDDADDEEALVSPVLGYIHLRSVDSERKRVGLLSPLAGRLPRKRLVFASLEWSES